MILETFVFEVGHLEVNLFIMGEEATREAVLIDAGVCDPSVLDFVKDENLKVGTILLTHLHPDHVGGVKEYAKEWGAEVISPAPHDNAPDARIIEPGASLCAGPFQFEVFQTSGHTPESISYYCAAEGVCFVGDAIFAGAVGGTSEDPLHEEEVGHIRRHIMTLPPGTELYSGHGPATTVAIEAAANPFLQPGFTRLP